MTSRNPMKAADLFVLLDREFRRRKPRECQQCFVQLPYRIDVRGTDDANWELFLPNACSAECTSILDDIVRQYQDRYNLVG